MAAGICDTRQRCDCRLMRCKICNPEPRQDYAQIANLEKLVKDVYLKAKAGRRRAKGHNCDGTAACQSIIDRIDKYQP